MKGRGWLYNLDPPRLMTLPPRPAVAGDRGLLWVFSEDGEIYGVEAQVLYAVDGRGQMTLQTATPLDEAFRGIVTAWALLVDGEVLAAG